ncbi:MAG: hypothetical protein NTW25_07050 [Candidatus Kapabacteria bacterium]|nr:hypothetical protein [Candidatus Kapabacteria bacterium]
MSKKDFLSVIAIAFFAFAIYSCSNDSKVVGNDTSSNSGKNQKPTSLTSFPSDRYYSEDDMWIKMVDDSTGIIGVTEIGVPSSNPSALITEDIPIRIKHPPKARIFVVSDINKASIFEAFSPVNGTFLNWNTEAFINPALVSNDPYNSGWVLTVTGVAQSDLNTLMTSAQYKAYKGL